MIFRAFGGYIVGALVIALALAVGYGLWQRGQSIRASAGLEAAQSELRVAEFVVKQAEETLAAEREYAQRLSKIAGQHERDKYEIEQRAASDIADLRSGALRLHDRWAACAATSQLSAASAAAGKPDDGAASREDSAVRIVRAAEQCDAQVRGLQAVVMADRQ